jgi:hypothetical protein
LLGLAAVAALSLSARAQVVVAGDAQGCFGLGCTPMDSHAINVDGVWLRYGSGSTLDFQGVTSDGVLAIDGSTATGNFGVLNLATKPLNAWINVPFTLSLGYINPATTTALFAAIITGYISSTPTGDVVAVFSPPSVTNRFFDYRSGLTGDLTVTPYSVTVPYDQNGPITGLIQVSNTVPTTVTPEPVTVLMLGSGLVGIAVVRRRRRATEVE